jgi:hypothetical protein
MLSGGSAKSQVAGKSVWNVVIGGLTCHSPEQERHNVEPDEREAGVFARVTRYRMKPESIETATAMLHAMKAQIMALPGMKQFINTVNSDGSGCVIAIVESRAISEANEPATQTIWAQYKDHLLAPPTADGFEVIVDWRN